MILWCNADSESQFACVIQLSVRKRAVYLFMLDLLQNTDLLKRSSALTDVFPFVGQN